jgi:hypothetical protein
MDVGNSTLIFDAAATQVMSFDVYVDGDGSTEFDGAGSRNFSNNFSTMPELRAHAGVTWLMGDHSANLTFRHIDSYKNDQSNDAEVDSWNTIDAQYSILLPGLIGEGDTRLTVGVNNLTDEDPPALYRNDANGNRLPLQGAGGVFDGIDRPGYDDRAGHDIRGRIVYFRFVQGF